MEISKDFSWPNIVLRATGLEYLFRVALSFLSTTILSSLLHVLFGKLSQIIFAKVAHYKQMATF